MKKGMRLFLVVGLLLVFSFAFASAGFFSDFFAKITGQVEYTPEDGSDCAEGYTCLSSELPGKILTFDGKSYIIELIVATDDSATVRVNSETKEINELSTLSIGGLYVYLASADETTLKFSATLKFSKTLAPQPCVSCAAPPSGCKYVEGSCTSCGTLVCDGDGLKIVETSKEVSLDSDNPKILITFDNINYEVELLSATDSSASIEVTTTGGQGFSKELSVLEQSIINGLLVKLVLADEDNGFLSVTLRLSLATSVCTDSDGGLDYYVKGTTTGVAGDGTVKTFEDECKDLGTPEEPNFNLIEMTCGLDGTSTDYVYNHVYNCPNGCVDGACVGVADIGTNNTILNLFKNAQILWTHDGKSCAQEAEAIGGTCVSSVISTRSRIDTATGHVYPEGREFIVEDAPQSCDTIYNMEPDLSKPGQRANYCVVATATSDEEQKILNLFDNAQIFMGNDGKSCAQEAETIGGTCISSIMSFRQRIDSTMGRLYDENINNKGIPNLVFAEAPQKCNAIYNEQPNSTFDGARANYCVVATATSDEEQKILNLFDNAQILWAHDGKSCSEECVEQLSATCVSSIISFRERISPTTGYLDEDASDFVWMDATNKCDSVYDMGSDLSKPGQRANYCVCASPNFVVSTSKTQAFSPTEEPKFSEVDGEVACSNGCVLDGSCYPYNNRKTADVYGQGLTGSYYCDVSGRWAAQSEDGASCDNNFECSSNVCVSSQCVEGTLIQKILNWFRNLFG